MVSDIVGVPDLFPHIKPILKSMIPGQEADERVRGLKPWVRVVVTVWVATTVPALLALFGWLFMNTPLIVTSAWDALLPFYDAVWEAFEDNNVVEVLTNLIEIVLLLIPVAGLAIIYVLVGKRLGKLGWNATRPWLARKPAFRTGLAITGVVAAGVALSAIINIDLFWPAYRAVLASADPSTSTSSPAIVASSPSKTTSTSAISSTSETASAPKETMPTVAAVPSVGTDGSTTMPVTSIITLRGLLKNT